MDQLDESGTDSPNSSDETRARYLAESGNFDEAIRNYRRLIRVCEDTDRLSALYGHLGDALLEAGDIDHAIDAFKDGLAHSNSSDGTAIQHRRLGTAYREKGNYERASDELEEAETLLRVSDDPEERAHLKREQGRLAEELGLPARALECYQQALSLHRAIGDSFEEIASLRCMASAMQELGDLGSAKETLQTALSLLQEHARHDRPEYIELTTLLGSIVEDAGDGHEALVLYERALSEAKQIDYEVGRLQILQHMGSAHAGLGNLNNAIECFQQAIRLARKLEDDVALSGLYGDLGEAHLEIGEVEEAVEEFQQALAKDQGHKDTLGMAIQHRRLGKAFQELGEYARAEDELDTAEQILRQIDDEGERAILLTQRGALHEANGRYEHALTSYAQSLNINETRGQEMGAVICHRHIASACVALRRLDEAASHLGKCLMILDAHGAPDGSICCPDESARNRTCSEASTSGCGDLTPAWCCQPTG
jgi:tetratricopeptide (TPR) repeat protein